MRRRRGIVVGVASVCLAASLGAPAHGADSTPHFERVVDQRGDVSTARGDLVGATMRYRTHRFQLTAELRRAGSFKSANWQHGDTFLLWYLDTNLEASNEYSAVVFNNGRDRLRGIIIDDWGDLKCRARVRQRGDVFILTAPHACIGSPRYARFVTYMAYDRNVAEKTERSLTIDRAPRRGWSRTVRRPPQPSTVTLKDPERRTVSVPYGGATLFTATVYTADGERLSLWRRYHGSTRWEQIASATNDDSSWPYAVTFRVEPRRSADFQVRFAGDKWNLPSRSRIVTVYPRMIVTQDQLGLQRRPKGSVFAVTGRVRPANAGGTVWLQRQTSTGWVSEATATINAENAYELRHTLTTSGRFVYRVLASGTGPVKAGASDLTHMEVYSARITKVEPSDAVTEATDLNSEYISVVNDGRVPINVADWRIDANLLTSVRIPTSGLHTRLDPGDGVRIHTGSGEASVGHLYLGRMTPMWPPTGTARLFDYNGVLISRYDY